MANEIAVADVEQIDSVIETTPTSPVDKVEGQVESETTTTEAPVTEKVEGEDVGEQDKPFNENPKFKQRIQQIEEKYSGRASNWDNVAQIAETDPEFGLQLIERMEKNQMVPPGTYERAKKELATRTPEKAEEKKTELTSEQTELQKLIENHPAVKYAQEKLIADEREKTERVKETENWLQTFEKERPDIAKTSNPAATRQQIMLEAQRIMETQKVEFEPAMAQAYKWVVKREELLEEYRQKGEISGLVNNIQQNVTAPVKGSNGSGSATRALSEEESRAAKSMGVDAEEYVRLLEDENAGRIV